MSVVGLSPSDIVGAARIVNRGTGALRDAHPESSKQKYRQSRADLNSRINALESLKHLAESSAVNGHSASLRNSAESTAEAERRHCDGLDKYERDLGQDARDGKRRGVYRKLRYEFGQDGDTHAYEDRSRSGVDAVILNSIL